MDVEMAANTNLIKFDDDDHKRYDIYELMLSQLKSYAKGNSELSDNLKNILDNELDRSLVKSVFNYANDLWKDTNVYSSGY